MVFYNMERNELYRKIIAGFANVLTTVLAVIVIISSTGGFIRSASMDDGYNIITVGDEKATIENRAFICADTAYVPLSVLEYCGYTITAGDGCYTLEGKSSVTLTEYTGEVTASTAKDEAGKSYLVYDDEPYISRNTYKALTDEPLDVTGSVPTRNIHVISIPDKHTVSDKYRVSDKGAQTMYGITVADGRGMECIEIDKDSADDYAAIVNSFAAALPDVNTYVMIAPNSAEFYAPKSMAPNQWEGISEIYSSLDDGIFPVNVVEPLMEHADEDIYFKTDHHWTQIGAYYAYAAFAELCGFAFPDISEFDPPSEIVIQGSFKTTLADTILGKRLADEEEIIGRYSPRAECSSAVYNDMLMEDFASVIGPYNENNNTYSTFISGDSALTVITTDNKNGRKLAIIKDSYANALAVWTTENYEEIYIIDPRAYSGYNPEYEDFNLQEFYDFVQFDDLLFVNYPVSVVSENLRASLWSMLGD